MLLFPLKGYTLLDKDSEKSCNSEMGKQSPSSFSRDIHNNVDIPLSSAGTKAPFHVEDRKSADSTLLTSIN